MGLSFYRMMFTQHRNTMELRTAWPPGRKPRNCADARYLADVWTSRAFQARKAKEKWIARWTLRDFPFFQGVQPWPKAVREVQRPFPGTESWLLSCSDAEGWEPGSDVWIGYAGVPFSYALRDSDTVGGPMQFRWSTLKGMFRHGLEYIQERGYRVPRHLRLAHHESESAWLTAAWLSALGQAIAAGWARYTGNDNQHWIASWSNGCR